MKTRVYCSGFWKVPGNAKRPADHYLEHLPETLKMLRGATIYFFSNHIETIDEIGKLCTTYDILLEPKHIETQALPGWQVAGDLVQCCEKMNLDRVARSPSTRMSEKGVAHYWRDLRGSGEDAYRHLLAIWMSKIPITASLASEKIETESVAWVDISIARFNGKRSNWNFAEQGFSPNVISHYASPMTYHGAKLPLNASFMVGGKSAWNRVRSEFEISTAKATEMPYGHDEETILADCVWRAPELFFCVGTPNAQNTFTKKLQRRLSKILSA